jgi:hypothetical protein
MTILRSTGNLCQFCLRGPELDADFSVGADRVGVRNMTFALLRERRLWKKIQSSWEVAMSDERRGRLERRGRDIGPPRGCFDRRRNAERRLPEAGEAELSADDFAKYFGSVTKAAQNIEPLDLAAEVFDRVRDL